jgi:PAS domain S-box-containing protein
MTIRQKTMLLTGSLLAISLLVVYLTAHVLFLRHINRIEQDRSIERLTTARNALENSAHEIQRTLFDWAVWDATYQFMEDGNPGYVKENLLVSEGKNIHINLVVFMKPSVQIPYARSYDFASMTELPVPSDLINDLSAYQKTLTSNATSGLLWNNRQIYLVASHPIYPTGNTPPSRGTLFFGRLFDDAERSRLTAIVQQPFTLTPNNAPPVCSLNQPGPPEGSSNSTCEVRGQTICTYATLKDIFGRQTFTLTIESPRTMYRNGIHLFHYFMTALFLIGAVLISTTLVLQQRLALDPLTRLSEQVRQIGQKSLLSDRIDIPGVGVELDSLVASINRTLNALEKAQIEMKNSAKKFSSLFESMTEGVAIHELICDADGHPTNYRIIDVNPAYLRHTGLSAQQVKGALATKAYGITPPPFLDDYAQVAKTGCTHSFETYFAPSGKYFAISVFSPGKDAFATVFEDITERKKAEEQAQGAQAETERLLALSEQSQQALLSVAEDQKTTQAALRESEEQYRMLFDGAGDAIFLHDEKERILAANTMACGQYGYTQSELTSMTTRMVDTSEQGVHIQERMNRLIEQGYTKFETVHRRKNGSLITTEVNARRMTWRGQPVIMSICRDITERKRAEKEREDSIELLNLLNTAGNRQELIKKIVVFFQNLSGCEALGVRLQDGEDFPYYETIGFSSDFVQAESRLCKVSPGGQPLRDKNGSPILDCMCGNILCRRFEPVKPFFSAHGSFWTNSTSEWLATTSNADGCARIRNQCHRAEYESVALIPLHTGATMYGLMQFNDRRQGRFTPEFITLLEKLCDSVASALAQRTAEERLRETLSDIEKFNRLMIGREIRTLELKQEINTLLAKLGEPPRYTTTLETQTSM